MVVQANIMFLLDIINPATIGPVANEFVKRYIRVWKDIGFLSE
jgi:hypothetical protein